MKKNIGYFGALLLIVGLLYSRSFFLQNSIPDYSVTTKAGEQATCVTTTVPAIEPGQLTDSDTLTFPPKSQPLVLPSNTYPPFNIKDETGRWRGADIEIVEAVLGRMGYRVEWVEIPFARSLEEMKTAKFPAMAPCVVGGGREEYIFFSAPVSSIFSVLWKKKRDDFSWHTYDDLKWRVIGASYYNYGAGFLEAGKAGQFKLDMVAANAPEIIHFRKLLQNKIDMFICERSVGLYLRTKHAPEFDEVNYAPTGVGPARPFCFAVSRKYFEGREKQMHEFVDAFNRELAIFSREGERIKIFDKYHMLIPVDDQGMIVVPGGI